MGAWFTTPMRHHSNSSKWGLMFTWPEEKGFILIFLTELKTKSAKLTFSHGKNSVVQKPRLPGKTHFDRIPNQLSRMAAHTSMLHSRWGNILALLKWLLDVESILALRKSQPSSLFHQPSQDQLIWKLSDNQMGNPQVLIPTCKSLKQPASIGNLWSRERTEALI